MVMRTSEQVRASVEKDMSVEVERRAREEVAYLRTLSERHGLPLKVVAQITDADRTREGARQGEKIFIDAERLGLPAAARPTEILAKVYEMADRLGYRGAKARSASTADDRRVDALLERVAALTAGERVGAGGARTMLDPTVQPKAGETTADSIMRRFAEHKAKCAVEGRKPLGIREWMAADKTLHGDVHQMAESERLAPSLLHGQAQAAVLRELAEAAAALMRNDPKLGKGSAQMLALKNDPDLAARYRGLYVAALQEVK